MILSTIHWLRPDANNTLQRPQTTGSAVTQLSNMSSVGRPCERVDTIPRLYDYSDDPK